MERVTTVEPGRKEDMGHQSVALLIQEGAQLAYQPKMVKCTLVHSHDLLMKEQSCFQKVHPICEKKA